MSRKWLAQRPGRTLTAGQDFVRVAGQNWRACFDPGDDEFYVYTNCGFVLNTPHPSDPQELITGIQVSDVVPISTNAADNTLGALWDITLSYGPWSPLEFAFDGNPVHLPVRCRFEFTVTEVAAFEDVDGDPIVNAAGDPYDPPQMRKVVRCSLFVDRNEPAAGLNLNNLMMLSNTVNLNVWNGFPPNTAYLNPVKFPEVKYSQVTNAFYYPFTYQFDINWDTWATQVVNAGLRQLDSEGNLIPILINGQPATAPVPLDIDGHAILAPEYPGDGTGEGGDDDGDAPDDANPVGETGEQTGGGEAPTGGSGTIAGSSIVIDEYQFIRAYNFSGSGGLNMDSLFTLPVLT